MNEQRIYLASPYSDPDPAVKVERFNNACQAAAAMMRQGQLVFSPIAHTHPIGQFGLPGGWDLWERYDRTFLDWCDEVAVLTLPGWESSKGVQAEMRLAAEMGKPVGLVEFDDLLASDEPVEVNDA